MLIPRAQVTLRCLLIVCILAIVPFVQAAAESPTPVLVELFTSEGCSSCPPADALLRSLDTNQPVSGVQLIVLGEHVDYWDDQGWRDVYSDHDFTVRQQNYADRLRLKGPYTPQMVVDGSLDVLGSDRQRVAQAFEKARVNPKVGLQLSSVRLENGVVRAHIETDAVSSAAEIFVALALDHAASQVLRGENSGHQLEHVAIARRLTKVGKVGKAEKFSKDVEFKVSPAHAAYRLVAFAQERGQGKIVAVSVQRIGGPSATASN